MDKREKRTLFSCLNFKTYNYLDWCLFFQLFLTLLAAALCLTDAIITVVDNKNKDVSLLWFGNLDKFTQQTNILLFIFVWIYFWKPNAKCFKDCTFLMSCMTYIFITFSLFNGYKILTWIGVFPEGNIFVLDKNKINDHEQRVREVRLVKDIITHVIAPIVFIVYGFFVLRVNKKLISNQTIHVLISSIYPIVYLIYAVSIPWLGRNDNGKDSYSVYGILTQTKYHPESWIWIPFMFISIPILEYLLVLINNKGICKNIKNI